MPSLEEQRRAIGTAIEQQRRAIGTAIEQQRRAGGAAMVARRRGQATVDDINSLVSPASQRKTLTTLDPRGRLEAKQGRGDYTDTRPNQAGGTGVAWPLVESDYDARTYHTNGLASSDGLFTIPAIDKLVLTDAEGRTGEVRLAEPPAPTP